MEKKIVPVEVDVRYDVLIFDRSNPHEIIGVKFDGDKRKDFSRLDDLRAGGYVRTDCALVNEIYTQYGNAVYSHDLPRQHAVYFTPEGNLTGSGVKYLDNDHRMRLAEIYRKIKAAGEKYPEMLHYIGVQA
jgi:hypothetical protein